MAGWRQVFRKIEISPRRCDREGMLANLLGITPLFFEIIAGRVYWAGW